MKDNQSDISLEHEIVTAYVFQPHMDRASFLCPTPYRDACPDYPKDSFGTPGYPIRLDAPAPEEGEYEIEAWETVWDPLTNGHIIRLLRSKSQMQEAQEAAERVLHEGHTAKEKQQILLDIRTRVIQDTGLEIPWDAPVLFSVYKNRTLADVADHLRETWTRRHADDAYSRRIQEAAGLQTFYRVGFAGYMEAYYYVMPEARAIEHFKWRHVYPEIYLADAWREARREQVRTLPVEAIPVQGMTLRTFPSVIGEVLSHTRKYLWTGGGEPDPDSRRGFGPTEGYHEADTTTGWHVWYGDNTTGYYKATDPEGNPWKVTQGRDGDTSLLEIVVPA